MNKILHFALLYIVIGLTFVNSDGKFFSSLFGIGHHGSARAPASICSNPTTAQLYLPQMLVLINNLRANSSYNPVLQLKYANFVSSLQNTTNQALFSTNCTTFVANLKAAQLADKAAERAREQIDSNIQRQFQQAARNATGSNGPNELDSDEEHEHEKHKHRF